MWTQPLKPSLCLDLKDWAKVMVGHWVGRTSGRLLAFSIFACAGVAIGAPTPQVSGTAVKGFEAEVSAAKMSMMTDPKSALAHAVKAQALSASAPDGPDRQIAAATAVWLQAEAMFRTGQARAAIPVVDAILPKVLAVQPGSKLAGDLVLVHGKLSASTGSVSAALADFQRAYRIYGKAGVPRSQAIALQQIGSIYEDAHDYPHVLQYYRQSSEAFSGDPKLELAAHNNLAEAFKGMGRFPEAEVEFRKALDIARKLEAQILNNVASAQVAGGEVDAAETSVRAAMTLAANDKAAAEEKPFLWGERAVIALKRGQIGDAKAAIEHTFTGVDLAATEPSFLDFHKAAFDIYTRLGDDRLALQHLKASKRLEDAARELAASTNSALMSAQFDFANQDLKIARLKAEELQKAAQTRVIVTVLVGGAGTLILVLVTFGFFQMRRSRNEVRAANGQLETSNQALEKALKAKTEFLATTSHEIRTPLNGILGMTEVLLADPQMVGPTRERLSLVHSSGQTMRALVDDLLDVAKNESGGLDVVKAEMDLGRLLKETAATWIDKAETKGLKLILSIDAAPARIIEDKERLRQVMSNLMSNAIKFTDTGTVELNARADGDHLVLKVTDTGVGIASADHQRIFESFTQVDSSTQRKYAGTGLGLTICRNIATALGGSITVMSEPGQGSTFVLDLPLTVVEAPEAIAEGSRSELDDAYVLVVEANPLSQSMMRVMLQARVRHLEIVADMAAAAAACAVQSFDHIIADGPTLFRCAQDEAAAIQVLRGMQPPAAILVLTDPKNEAALTALETAGIAARAKPVNGAALLEALSGSGPAATATDVKAVA
jgi:signal transduction histidine kinase/tetratricopeptide (TPR) repeat protein